MNKRQVGPTVAKSHAEGRVEASLRVLTRLWIAGATGCVRRTGAPRPIARLCRGGVVSPHDVESLRASLGAGLHFDPMPVPGTPDRAAVAALLRATALALVGRVEAPCTAPQVSLLAAERTIEELGLADAPGAAHDADRHARLLALERMGLVRLRFLDLAPSVAVAAPCARLVAHDEDLGDELTNDPESADLAWADAWEDEGDVITAEIDAVRQRMRLGQWEVAERLLVGLRDRRLDNPHVLSLLALARVGDPRRVDAERVADARRWALLARQLGSADPEAAQALEAAWQRIEHAEARLADRALPPTRVEPVERRRSVS